MRKEEKEQRIQRRRWWKNSGIQKEKQREVEEERELERDEYKKGIRERIIGRDNLIIYSFKIIIQSKTIYR